MRPWLFPLQVTLLTLFWLGHAAISVGLINRVHGLGLPRKLIKGIAFAAYGWLFFLPLGLAWLTWRDGWPNTLRALLRDGAGDVWTWTYLIISWVAALTVLSLWIRRRIFTTPPRNVQSLSSTQLPISESLWPTGTPWARFWRRIPKNDVISLRSHHEACQLADLPRAMEGLSVAHISDLHMCRIWSIDYFHALVDHVQDLAADMVVLTGDICDHPECISWIEPTLGRIRAPHGKYYVLGNHDPRTRAVPEMQRALHAAGFVALGQQSVSINVGGGKVLLAGNEAPWFAPPGQNDEPIDVTDADLSILLVHTPDLFSWGATQGYDLIFAGHAHGGQICLPVVGPIVSPCRSGVLYSSGWFSKGQTLMRVSRGSASIFPFRWNCPPEIAHVEIRCG